MNSLLSILCTLFFLLLYLIKINFSKVNLHIRYTGLCWLKFTVIYQNPSYLTVDFECHDSNSIRSIKYKKARLTEVIILVDSNPGVHVRAVLWQSKLCVERSISSDQWMHSGGRKGRALTLQPWVFG